MRKISFLALFISALLSGSILHANSYKTVQKIEFYGIDFSKCQVLGAGESESLFISSFYRINQLLINEAPKYDVEKYVLRPVEEINLKEVNRRNADASSFLSYKHTISLMTKEELETYVDNFTFADAEGHALIVICDVLDKYEGMGLFHYVFVDKSNNTILYELRVRGKSGGFGLRNYWARTFYNSLKKLKYSLY